MALPSRAKTAQYRKALPVGAALFFFQIVILIWVVMSRTLAADTLHAFLDVVTLAGTYALYRHTWANEHDFAHCERRWLLVGVCSLVLGGIIIGVEAVHHLSGTSAMYVPPAWPLLLAALIGALGNWWMHSVLEGAPDAEHDALHKNNLDHVFWDMILSGAVFVSGCSVWFFGTMAVDSWIAVFVGFVVLPYFAWKRWRDRGHTHHHD